MSPINTLSILGFASAALAVPYHGHGHPMHHHGGQHKPSGFSVFPYPSANGTVIGSTGFATGTASPSNYAPQPVGPATETAEAVASQSVTTMVEESTYFNAASGTICTTDVTVTSKVKVTVTVTADASESPSSSEEVAPTEAPSSSASSSRARSTLYITSTLTQQHSSSAAAPSSSEAAPVESSPAPSSSAAASSSSDVSPPAYSAPISSSASSSASSSVAAAVTESSSSTESSSAVFPTLTYSEANKQAAYTSSSSSAAPTQSSSYGGSSGTGKRGVAYNDASLTDCFTDSPQITWGYNWGSASSGLSSKFSYIPQLWSSSSEFTQYWDQNAKASIKAGSNTLFSFNEPDLSSQANMNPSDAAAAYKQYMEPYGSDSVKLCAPAVTNGGGDMGLTWLQNFMDACHDCQIDCVNVHWYDSAENTDYFTSHIQNATEISGGKPVYVSEFGATGSDDQISTFLTTVMDWMDKEDSVAGYAYFMVSDGKLVTGTEPSSYGKVYAGDS